MELICVLDVHTRDASGYAEVVLMKTEKNVSQVICEVIQDICDNYCKYPIIYQPTYIDNIDDDYMGRMFEERCNNCPLRRLA